MTRVWPRRIIALAVVLAIALAGLEWCLGHQHPTDTGVGVSALDCPSGESLHLAEQTARQPSVTADEPVPPPALNRAEAERADARTTVTTSSPRSRSGVSRLIDNCVWRT